MDFKQALAVDTRTGAPSNVEKSDMVKTIAALLNTEGGTILLGVSDAGEIKGIAPDVAHCTHQNTDGFELKLRQMLDAQLQPPPHSRIGVSFETFPEGTVCRVDVPASPGITYFDNTEVYIRDGNRSSQLTGRNLVEWSATRNTG